MRLYPTLGSNKSGIPNRERNKNTGTKAYRFYMFRTAPKVEAPGYFNLNLGGVLSIAWLRLIDVDGEAHVATPMSQRSPLATATDKVQHDPMVLAECNIITMGIQGALIYDAGKSIQAERMRGAVSGHYGTDIEVYGSNILGNWQYISTLDVKVMLSKFGFGQMPRYGEIDFINPENNVCYKESPSRYWRIMEIGGGTPGAGSVFNPLLSRYNKPKQFPRLAGTLMESMPGYQMNIDCEEVSNTGVYRNVIDNLYDWQNLYAPTGGITSHVVTSPTYLDDVVWYIRIDGAYTLGDTFGNARTMVQHSDDGLDWFWYSQDVNRLVGHTEELFLEDFHQGNNVYYDVIKVTKPFTKNYYEDFI
ncbi:MAG: hypothetical protein LPH21_13345 [Shewanella sp.]|nr:hypothetical protein [Shewanella sp.]